LRHPSYLTHYKYTRTNDLIVRQVAVVVTLVNERLVLIMAHQHMGHSV